MSNIEKCAFCRVVKGQTPVSAVYEDDDTLAFLHVAAVNLGHCLVIPRKHYPAPTSMPDGQWGDLMARAVKIAVAVMRATESVGYNLVVANGACAGENVPHACVHIIPRNPDDGITWPARTVQFDTDAERQELIDDIRRRLEK